LTKNHLNQSELAMSRSLGDFEFKANKELPSDQQAVIAIPEFVTRERSERDALLIVACDGVWDVLTNAQTAEYVLGQIQSFPSDQDHVLARVADRLCRHCFDEGSNDNLSVVLVALGEMAARLTPASVPSPSFDTEPQPRKLAFDASPDARADAETATPSSAPQDLSAFKTPNEVQAPSTEELSTYRTPGHVQML
jgi:serine/threonine protein phosphatase PrpC